MTRRMVQRAAFLLLAAVMALGAARLPTSPQRDAANEVYIYNGYAAATDAPWDEKSLELAAHRFQHLIDTYFTDGGYHFYLSVVPDKAQFTQPPEGYVPAGAADTADWLAARLPVQTVDIASLLALEDYYRTDLHWRQERLLPVAQRIGGGTERNTAGGSGGDALRSVRRVPRQLLGQNGGDAGGGYLVLSDRQRAGGLHRLRLRDGQHRRRV